MKREGKKEVCMDVVERRKAARKFVEDWKDRGDEKQDTQNFWNQLLRNLYLD